MNDSQSDKSIGELFKGVTEDLSTLVRSEIALAKLELQQMAGGIGAVAAMFTVSLFFALVGVAMLLVTAVLALSLVVPGWLASLIIAIVLLIVAGVLFILGRKRVSTIQFAPATIANVKTDIESIKTDIARMKRG